MRPLKFLKTPKGICFVLMFLWVSTNCSSALYANSNSYIILVHKDSSLSSISKSDLKLIFLGKKKLWRSGKDIKPYYLSSETINSNAMKEVTSMSKQRFSSFWMKKVFSGSGSPPVSEKYIEGIIAKIKTQRGAIGIVPASDDLSVYDQCKMINVF